MKYVFLLAFCVMAAFSFVAWMWTPGEAADGTIELVWVSDDNPMRREQIDQFNRLYPPYRIRLDPQPGGMEKVIVQCLAGVGPDLFDCYDGFQLAAYVRSGMALDCTEELARRGIDIDSVWPCLRPLIVHEGRVYGHPGNANAPALWYNKTLFDAAAEPYPRGDWTWEEFIAVAQRLTRYDNRGRPTQFGVLMGPTDWYDVFIGKWGARLYTPEGTRCALDSPEAAAAAQFYQDLIYKHAVMPSPTEELAMASTGGWGTSPIHLFGAGRAAMAVGGRWWLCILRTKDYASLRLGAVELPRAPSPHTFGGGRSTLVNARGKHLEGALAFLEYLHSREWNDLVNWQADALAPVMKYSYTEAFLHDPEHPEEDYNAVWRGALEAAIPYQTNPYVNGQTVGRILLKQADLIRARQKTGAQAMKDAAQLINRVIVEQLRLDPELRERYQAAVALGAPPAWDNEEDAP